MNDEINGYLLYVDHFKSSCQKFHKLHTVQSWIACSMNSSAMTFKHNTLIILFIGSVFSLRDMMFKKTTNMTSSSWLSFLTRELTTPSFYLCAAQCLKESGNCNSWHYDQAERLCQLGKVLSNKYFSYEYFSVA